MSFRELPEDLKSVAKSELNEDETLLGKDVNHILDWLKKQPHINARKDPQWLVGFLRGCKHSLERTKEKIDAYYTIRTHLPELFADRDPKSSRIQEILDLGTYLPLPLTDKPDSPRIVLIRGAIYDPNKYTFLEIFTVNFMIMDLLLLEDDRLDVAGQDTLLDLTGGRVEHVSQFSPTVIKKVVTCFQDAYPIRTKSLHFINTPTTFDLVFAIFKRFMKDKLRQRIKVHSTVDKVYDYIPKQVLPSDYGGDGPSVAKLTSHWKQKVLDNREFFLEDAKFGVTESKRPGKPISGADLFGVEGSFKQLSID
ncbi:retinol-binding protein pinta [Cephus cinctus]|uniref:Retinol-binding protein pinta n=1 Tax=Cephus cinctus TaxID=211228 RepID=A0AAJ7BKV5_CEPCN|nr:retinol-binding protein pinta [Cephus cinctus]XP_015588153.1 retinol-binding protein pinta [Cephus cinctus]XP_015588154.1 retinol-binding protein pinta [Cephus cinctus]XP_024937485.1 retinol-binding protein pinta [Cephus cinctus]